MARSRVKLDLGPHGKVLASVQGYDDAKAVAASRLNVDQSSVQLFVSDGQDLWELHPSAFQDVLADDGIIVAKAVLRPPINLSASAAEVAEVAAAEAALTPLSPSPVIPKPDVSHTHSTVSLVSSPVRPNTAAPAAPAAATAATQSTAEARPNMTSALSMPYSRPARRRSDSTATTDTTSSNSSSSSSSTSSAGSSSSSSSSSSDRRSESVQDVTASSAIVRTFTGPYGLPVSSKERWDPKTHRLMFEKLSEIISSETIYYTRKYTEERFRIFQLLIDQYGDSGTKGNFLRGRTAAALISRVSGVLRTARERGEKIKQPFKFFFPNKKGDEAASGSAKPSTTTVAAVPRNRPDKPELLARRTAADHGAAAAPPPITPTSSASTSLVVSHGQQLDGLAGHTPGVEWAHGQGKRKGKGKGRQPTQTTTNGQVHPPRIQQSSANAALRPGTTLNSPKGAKRPANGNGTSAPPAQKKKTHERQPDPHHSRRTGSHPAASSIRRGRRTSPRCEVDNDSRYSPRTDRPPRPEWDTWIRSRDGPLRSETAANGRDDGGSKRADLPPTVPLARQPGWIDGTDDGDHALFRAETRSPLHQPHRSTSTCVDSTPAQALSSPTPRRNAVERALEQLVQTGYDPSSPPESLRMGHRRSASPHREWHRNSKNESIDTKTPDPRPTPRSSQRQSEEGRNNVRSWPIGYGAPPSTPPRAE